MWFRPKDESNSSSDYKHLEEIAWTEKRNVLNQYTERIKNFSAYLSTYNRFLNGEASRVLDIDDSIEVAISEAVSLAVRQPNMNTIDDTAISLAITMDHMIELMDEIYDNNLKVKDDKVLLDRYKKELQTLEKKFDLLSDEFKNEYRIIKDNKSKEDRRKYTAEGRYIRSAQEELTHEFETWYNLLMDYSTGDFRLREIDYNTAYKQYILINNRISNFHKLLNQDKQVEKEVQSGKKSKQAIKDIMNVTEKLDYSMKQIVDYIEQMKGKQLTPREVNAAAQQESKLLHNYLLHHAQLVQAELNMKLNLRSYIVEE